MPTAYILINSILGKEEEIIKQISQIKQVREVRGTYGVHDIFVKIQTDSVDEMNNTITSNIRKINGITSTVTLVSIPEQGGRD
jgi:DNA-binding Lrp family transcriptional regulator